MRGQSPESLSEFEPEDGLGAETDPQPEVAVSGSLLDVVAAASPADTPAAPLSRIESRQARRRTSRLKRLARGVTNAIVWAAHAMSAASARAWSATIARAGSVSQRARSGTASAVHATGRVSEQARSTVRSAAATTRQHTSAAVSHAWAHTWSKVHPLAGVRTTSRTLLDDLEFNGAIVVMSLAVMALAYGGFQREERPAPVAPLSARAVETVPLEAIHPAAVIAAPAALPPAVSPTATTDTDVVTRPVQPALNAATLNAIWRRQDSRSLQQAFTGLRSQTLAFHRCGMRMTETDRAVATCEGASRAKWTINFRRSAGRWQIDRVSTR